MLEFPQDLAVTGRIIAVDSLYDPAVTGFPPFNPGSRLAARTERRDGILISSAVQIFLNMRDDHVPFGNQDPASRNQLQVLDEA